MIYLLTFITHNIGGVNPKLTAKIYCWYVLLGEIVYYVLLKNDYSARMLPDLV